MNFLMLLYAKILAINASIVSDLYNEQQTHEYQDADLAKIYLNKHNGLSKNKDSQILNAEETKEHAQPILNDGNVCESNKNICFLQIEKNDQHKNSPAHTTDLSNNINSKFLNPHVSNWF
ncbi:putative SP-containing protein [Vairimorpha necatrix]|uniref:SP-containing protein n=1 Tax=Vairimorpha necatrix TaxID=6039 RepID=A0AAX4JFB8_9MICR